MTSDYQTCLKNVKPVVEEDYSDELIQPDGVQILSNTIMTAIVGTPDEDTIRNVQKMEIGILIENYPLVFTVCLILMFAAVATLLGLIAKCIVRIRSRKNKQGRVPTLSNILGVFIPLGLGLALGIVSLGFYFRAARLIDKNSDVVIERIANDVGMIHSFTHNASCNLKHHFDTMASSKSKETMDIFKRLNNSFDATVIRAAGGRTLSTVPYTQLVKDLRAQCTKIGGKTLAACNNLSRFETDKKMAELDKTMTVPPKAGFLKETIEAYVDVAVYGKRLLDAIARRKTGVDKLTELMDEWTEMLKTKFVEKTTKNGDMFYAFSFFLILAIVLMFFLLILQLLTFVFLFFRIILKRDMGDKDDLIAKIARKVILGAGFLSMLATSALFLAALFAFLLGFVGTFVCVGCFNDPDYVGVSAIPWLHKNITMNNKTFMFSMHEVLVGCDNGDSFFQAIGGEVLLDDSAAELLTVPLIGSDLRIGGSVGNTDFINDFLSNVTAVKREFEASPSKGDASFNKSISELEQFVDVLRIADEKVNSRRFRDSIIFIFDDAIDEIYRLAISLIKDVRKEFDTNRVNCDDLVRFWRKLGNGICRHVVTPTQSIWFSTLLCSIASILGINVFFKSTYYMLPPEESEAIDLYDDLKTDEGSAEKPRERKKRKKTNSRSRETITGTGSQSGSKKQKKKKNSKTGGSGEE